MTDVTSPGRLLDTEYQDLVEFSAIGHREISPIIIEEEHGPLSIRGPHGLYRVGRHVNGHVVLLHAYEPSILTPMNHEDAAFGQGDGAGYWLNPDQADHIEVVEARDGLSGSPWIMSAVHAHAHNTSSDLLRYGYLYRTSDHMWVSGAIIYRLDPVAERSRLDKILGRNKEPAEEQRYALRCYTTKGKGHAFTDIDEPFWRQAWGRVLGYGARTTFVTMSEAQDIIADDFAKRQDLVMRGFDPDNLGPPLRDKEPDMESALSDANSTWLFHQARKIFNRCAQEIHVQYRSIQGKSIVLTVGKAIAMAGVLLLTRGIFAAGIKFGTILFSPIIHPIKAALSKAKNASIEDNNTAPEFWLGDHSVASGNYHYGLIDPEVVPWVELLDVHEIRVVPEAGAEVRAEMREDWAEYKLLDALGGPPGSIIEKRRVGNSDALYVAQPDGLEMTYLVGREVAYLRFNPEAVHGKAKPMPGLIRKLIEEKGPCIRIEEVSDGVLASRSVEPDRYDMDLLDEAINEVESGYVPRPDHNREALKAVWERVAKPVEETMLQRAWRVSGAACQHVKDFVLLRETQVANDNDAIAPEDQAVLDQMAARRTATGPQNKL